jgi:hypothetical protein
VDWGALRKESNYLGSSDVFIDRVMQAAGEGKENREET